MTTVGIIQARMTSTRLPGKVLADLCGEPMLGHMLGRVRRAKQLDRIFVATTDNIDDDPIVSLCDHVDVPTFRGDETDVLDRFAKTAATADADIVVRLTADCPMTDPAIVDEAVSLFASQDFDYLSNAVERTYPDGLDVEVFSRAALDRTAREAVHPFFREHVTPYMRPATDPNLPTGKFRVGTLEAPADFSHLSWTVDTAHDLDRVRAIIAGLPPDYGWMDALSLVTRQPNLTGDASPLPTRVALRPANCRDGGLLFDWVNSPDSLAASLRTAAPVDRPDHDAWFAARLSDPDSAIWIAEKDGAPSGQIRLEKRGETLEVSIYVRPDARGQGAAIRMLDLARDAAAQRWPGLPLLARIKADNKGSRRLFTRAGYGRMRVAADHVILRREPASARSNAK